MKLRDRFWERERRKQERRRDFYLIACRFDAPPGMIKLEKRHLEWAMDRTLPEGVARSWEQKLN